jgi:predicted amidohydrolase YtcJ
MTAAEVLFTGGSILTMDAAAPRVAAVAVANGRIAARGAIADCEAVAGPGTKRVDLGRRALLPGFVDGHGHLAKLAEALESADLSAPPVGTVTDIASLIEVLRTFIRERAMPAGQWVTGRGYDNAFLAESRHPTREDLDRVSTQHPIYLSHVSGHLGAANSLALELVGLSASTPNPPGGVIRCRPDGEPDGVVEENGMGPFNAAIPPASEERRRRNLAQAQRIYAASGITTAQEGAMFPAEQALLERAAEAGELLLDVAGYAFWAQAPAMLEGKDRIAYHGRFRTAGMKLMLDGSPQGKTAWLTKPYHVIPDGQPSDYRGYPAMPDERAFELVANAFERGWQVIAHCNGDAAAAQYIAAVRSAAEAHPSTDRRPVMIHAQTVRDDQLEEMVSLDIIPSFFVSHVYYWGDYHRDSVLGPERGARISPLASAERLGLRFNLHNDSPVVPPDIFRLMWCAVTRTTRSGKTLGPEQRVRIERALRAVTIDSAYAHFEEQAKGTIAVGKLADLVVLSADPTGVPAEDLLSIRVEATLKEGALVHGEL